MDRSASARLLCFVASAAICFGVWRWAEDILVPVNTAAAQSRGVPIGNNSDLYPRWFGARELLLHHRDPYSSEVTRDIQSGFYGRPLDASKPADPTDQAAFAYPLYVVFLLAPAVTLPFAEVALIFRWLLLLCIAASIPLWMRAIGLRASVVSVAGGMLLAVSSYPAVLEFHMQNLTALTALFLAAASAALAGGCLMTSGVLLALATIKPQISGLFVVWFALWVVGRWRERKRLAWSFSVTCLLLLLGSQLLLPGWINGFVAATRNYSRYATDPSMLGMFFPALISWILIAVLVGVVLGLCWHWRAAPAKSPEFALALAWTAVTTLAIVPITAYNQVLLIPAILVLIVRRDKTLSAKRATRALFKAVWVCQGWQWLTAALLGFASLMISASALHSLVKLPVYTMLALPPITLLAVAAATFSVPQTAGPIPQTLAAPRE